MKLKKVFEGLLMNTLLSFVIPVKDEETSLEELVAQITEAVQVSCPDSFLEILFIDDGSTDNSWQVMQAIANRLPTIVRAIRFRRNLGKALALEAGFRACHGDIVFTMDADLQDDPKEIPNFLEKLGEGFDLVSGWKRTRHDPLSKTLPSKLFNGVTSLLSGVKLNDFNCGFKCYRREVIDNIRLYGEMHRYIPVLAADLGYKVGEIAIEHHPRRYGQSKYGWERYVRGFIDLLTVLATTRWLAKPGHLFGGVGVLLGFIGSGSLAYLATIWLFTEMPIGNRPLLSFGVLSMLASLQMLSLGVVAEFFVKNLPIDLDQYISNRLNNDLVSPDRDRKEHE
jgi:glycosyltransferase involved in cell wall biosynthesis